MQIYRRVSIARTLLPITTNTNKITALAGAHKQWAGQCLSKTCASFMFRGLPTCIRASPRKKRWHFDEKFPSFCVQSQCKQRTHDDGCSDIFYVIKKCFCCFSVAPNTWPIHEFYQAVADNNATVVNGDACCTRNYLFSRLLFLFTVFTVLFVVNGQFSANETSYRLLQISFFVFTENCLFWMPSDSCVNSTMITHFELRANMQFKQISLRFGARSLFHRMTEQ